MREGVREGGREEVIEGGREGVGEGGKEGGRVRELQGIPNACVCVHIYLSDPFTAALLFTRNGR